MSIARRVVIAGLMSATVVGCAGPVGGDANSTPSGDLTETNMPALPPRPQDIRIDDVDPCSLLSTDQQRRLDVRSIGFSPADDQVGPSCEWVHSPEEPIEAYRIALNADFGIEAVVGNSRGTTMLSIVGFPAIETESERLLLPGTQCIVVVDVAPGQALQLNYDYSGALPTSRELACEKARPAAEMALQTLIGMTGG